MRPLFSAWLRESPTANQQRPRDAYYFYYYHYQITKQKPHAPPLSVPLNCLVVTSFYVTVKYLREVTPYIRKASILGDIGWDVQRQFLGGAPAVDAQPAGVKSDARSVPLLLCFLARRLRRTDGHVVEIHSPDSQQACFLRASDAKQASQWCFIESRFP